jgi:hypothetical protein
MLCSLKGESWVSSFFCSFFHGRVPFFTREFLFSRSSLNSSLFCSFFPKYEFLSSFFEIGMHFGVLAVILLNV